MADITPYNGLQPGVALSYPAPWRDDGESDMDYEERLRAAEMLGQRNADMIAGHERECALRYGQLVQGQTRIMSSIKYLAFSVGALALVVLGIATVQDLTRAAAARVGVHIQQPAGNR